MYHLVLHLRLYRDLVDMVPSFITSLLITDGKSLIGRIATHQSLLLD